jgi:hypothetical protein
MLELLAHQGGETVGTATKVHRLAGHQHPNSRRNRDHVAALTARSTVVKAATSIPGGTRTVAAPITISTVGDPPSCACAAGGPEHRWAASTITGTNADPLSPALFFFRRRASRRQLNSCCGVKPCRRATAQIDSSPSWLSAMIRAFCSAVHDRRRPVPVKTSSRRTGSGLHLGKSSVFDTCSNPLDSAVGYSPINSRI